MRLAPAVEAEIERRKALFGAVEGYPETRDEYNQAAQAQDREILKRLVVVFDEYTDTLPALRGADGAFSNLMTRLVIGAATGALSLCLLATTGRSRRRVGCASSAP